jgi:hypothetical protein
MYQVSLIREFTQDRSQEKGIEFIKRRILSIKSSWEITSSVISTPEEKNFRYIYTATLTFEKTSGQKQNAAREWLGILELLDKLGNASKFRPNPWRVKNDSVVIADAPPIEISENGQTRHAMANVGMTLQQVKTNCLEKIIELLKDKDAIQSSEYFQGIFERDAQIRVVLSSVKSFLETDGERRNHVLLYGLPACAKTQILNAITKFLGEASVVRLDGTSTTPAGIYKVYFENFNEIEEPPFVVLEEAEKTSEESLRVWLGALDDRGELRKVNYREQSQRNLKILCLATANDKKEFDLLMGGTERKPGALSSRFAHQIECPRPSERVMRLILERDIINKGGRLQWVEPVIQLAKKTATDDPRKVLAYLDGGERLESGEYQEDIISLYKPPSVISND